MIRPTLGILLASSVVVVSACTTKKVDTDNGSDSTGNTSGVTSAGVGGYGGSDASSSSSGGQGGAGTTTGSGGGSCVGDLGYQTAASCDEMTIAPSPMGPSAAICGESGTDNPPGYDLCLRAADIFTGGSFDHLQACLAQIGTNPEACELDPVAACVDDMFQVACDLPLTADNCATVAQQCADAGDYSFDEAQCTTDLRPFGDEGWAEMVDCFNARTDPGDCQTVWSDCYDNQVFVF